MTHTPPPLDPAALGAAHEAAFAHGLVAPGILEAAITAYLAAMRPAEERVRELVEALEEIARTDVGGLQGIAEDHEFDPADYSKDAAIERLRAWNTEETRYLMSRIVARRDRARTALARFREEG
jgi:hypothetical protein